MIKRTYEQFFPRQAPVPGSRAASFQRILSGKRTIKEKGAIWDKTNLDLLNFANDKQNFRKIYIILYHFFVICQLYCTVFTQFGTSAGIICTIVQRQHKALCTLLCCLLEGILVFKQVQGRIQLFPLGRFFDHFLGIG